EPSGYRNCEVSRRRAERIQELGRSRPGAVALAELLEREQPEPRIRARGRPRRLRVVAPGREEEQHVVQVRMRGPVLERLEAVLDEGPPGAPAALGGPGRD